MQNLKTKEFLSYFEKVEKTQGEIENTYRCVIDRHNDLVIRINEDVHAFGIKETEVLKKLTLPLCNELDEINKKRDSLFKQITDITNERKNNVLSYQNEQSKIIDAAYRKSMFCYDRYVKCIAEQFEKDNIPR